MKKPKSTFKFLQGHPRPHGLTQNEQLSIYVQ